MTIEGVDYSFARPGGAALAAAGKKFAVRYLWADGNGGKGLDAAELADLHAHGIEVPVVFESTTQRALAGRAAGAADAATAAAQLTALGMGPLPVYFAVDFNATQAQMAAIDEYLEGAATVLGAARVGVYGGIAVVAHCQAAGTAAWLWQTYAWSSGRVQPGIHLYQYKNGQTINQGAVDFTRALQDEYGQSPAGAAHSTEGSNEMTAVMICKKSTLDANGGRTAKSVFVLADTALRDPSNWRVLQNTPSQTDEVAQVRDGITPPATPRPSIELDDATFESWHTWLTTPPSVGSVVLDPKTAQAIADAVVAGLAPHIDALPATIDKYADGKLQS